MTSPINNSTRVAALSINGRVHPLRDAVWVTHSPLSPSKVFMLHYRTSETTPWVPLRITLGALAAVVEGCAVQTDGVVVTRAQDGVKPPPQPHKTYVPLGEQLRNKLIRGENIGRHDPPVQPTPKKRLTLRTAPTIGQRVDSFWRSPELGTFALCAGWLAIGISAGFGLGLWYAGLL